MKRKGEQWWFFVANDKGLWSLTGTPVGAGAGDVIVGFYGDAKERGFRWRHPEGC